MSFFKRTAVVFLFFICISGTESFAANMRVTNPSALSVEVLGRGFLYSVNYDQVMSEDFAAGFGIGRVPLNNTDGKDSGSSVTVLPGYFNYYFMKEQGSLYASGGLTIITDTNTAKGKVSSAGSVQFTSSIIVPNVGLGYENRAESGFMFRIAGYLMSAHKIYPWVGVTFGYTF